MVEDGNAIMMKSIFFFMSDREGDFGLSFRFFWGFRPLFHPQLGDFKDNKKNRHENKNKV